MATYIRKQRDLNEIFKVLQMTGIDIELLQPAKGLPLISMQCNDEAFLRSELLIETTPVTV